MMKQSTVTLKVSKLPDPMEVFGFPCGESDCYKTPTYEFQFATLDDDYRLPVCAMHAQRLVRAIGEYEKRISANN